MNKIGKSTVLFAVLIALTLPVMNCKMVFAKQSRELKLKSQVMNLSVFDKSKNDLVIEDASGLSKRVAVIPPGGKPVRLEGILKNGELHVDLTSLGRANTLPEGDYKLIAKLGKKKIKSSFKVNSPTLYVSKVSVPLSGLSDKAKQRVLRFHHNLEGNICYSDPCPNIQPDEPQCGAPVIEVSCDDPACNSGPCTNGEGSGSSNITCSCHTFDPETLEEGHEQEYPGRIEGDYIVADITLETTGDYEKPDCGIEAEIFVGGEKETEVSSIAFTSDEDGVVETETNNATDAATDVCLAAGIEAESIVIQNGQVEDADLLDLYNKTTEKCASLIDQAQDPETIKTLLASIAQEIALELKDVILESVSADIRAEMEKIAAEMAAKFGSKCPNFFGLPKDSLINPEIFNDVEYHEIAGGLLDPISLGVPEDAKVWFDLYQNEGIVLGSLKMPTSAGSLYEVDSAKLAENFSEMKKIAEEMGYEIPTSITIPPGCVFDPSKAVDSFEDHGISNASFTLASTVIVEGQYDASLYSSFDFQAEHGVIVNESWKDAFTYIPPQDHDFLPGTFLPTDGTGVATLPTELSEYLNTGDHILAGNWEQYHFGDSSNPIPTGWTPPSIEGSVSQPIPTGEIPLNEGSHPDESGHVGTISDPAPTGWTPTDGTTTTNYVPPTGTTTYVQPTYVPPPSDYHPPESH